MHIDRKAVGIAAAITLLLGFGWGRTGNMLALGMLPMAVVTAAAAFYRAATGSKGAQTRLLVEASGITVALLVLGVVSVRLGVQAWTSNQRAQLPRLGDVVERLNALDLGGQEADLSQRYTNLAVSVFARRTESAQIVVRFADGRRGVMYLSRDDVVDAGKPDQSHFGEVFRLEKIEPKWYTYVIK
jgi:hypothetical protein